jgi:metallo-beta-lactamase family protein
MISITFLGAARTVTGSKYLVESNGARMLVDAGLFQGLKDLRLRNWQDLPVPASSIQAVVLTHAHLDHCGYLPRLVAQGFRGRVFCTQGTQDLCRIVLPDAGRLQEEDAEFANRHQFSKHKPALPLYTEVDASRALTLLQPCGYDRTLPVVPGIDVEFVNAGHLLGSAYARMHIDGRTILFGGDLGRYSRPVLPDPTTVDGADYLLVESTYGDRTHEQDDDGARLAQIVTQAAHKGGKLIIPAFAIGRVEELLYWLKRLEEANRIPVLPVYLDSPMASAALARYTARVNELDPELQPEGRTDKAMHEREMCVFCTERFRVIASPQESKNLTASRVPAIVISSSGMAEGGRVLHHLKAALPDARNTVLFAGYQGVGTRGRRLVDGEKTVKIHGEWVPVAARIEHIDSMSAHADAGEIMRWLHGFTRAPQQTFIVHGEPAPQDALAARIQTERGWETHAPEHRETVQI